MSVVVGFVVCIWCVFCRLIFSSMVLFFVRVVLIGV